MDRGRRRARLLQMPCALLVVEIHGLTAKGLAALADKIRGAMHDRPGKALHARCLFNERPGLASENSYLRGSCFRLRDCRGVEAPDFFVSLPITCARCQALLACCCVG